MNIFRMVEDNLLVSNTISEDLVLRTFDLSMDQLLQFSHHYIDAVKQYQSDHSSTNMFYEYNVAISNNCRKFDQLFQVKILFSNLNSRNCSRPPKIAGLVAVMIMIAK